MTSRATRRHLLMSCQHVIITSIQTLDSPQHGLVRNLISTNRTSTKRGTRPRCCLRRRQQRMMLTDRQTPAQRQNGNRGKESSNTSRRREGQRDPLGRTPNKRATKLSPPDTKSSRSRGPSTCTDFGFLRIFLIPPHIPTHHAQNGHGDPPAPTRHCLILFCQCQHRQCRGLSLLYPSPYILGGRVQTSNQFHALAKSCLA